MEGEGRREGRGGRARYCFTVSTAAPLAPSSPSRSLSFASSASMCSEVLFGVSRRGGIGRDGGTEGEGTAGRYWGLLCLRRNSRLQVDRGAYGEF